METSCVQPFSLLDRNKPGMRTVAALFLVDPNTRATSTSDVPPQQKSWFTSPRHQDRLSHAQARQPSDDKLFPITLDEAKENRKQLMEERKFVQCSQEGWFERPFSLCEH